MPTELSRLSGCLHRLLPHLRLDSVAITGGVAIEIGLAASGRKGTRNRVADLDLVATSPAAVKASVITQFLVAHYHAVGPCVPKFMIQLVQSRESGLPSSRISPARSQMHARRQSAADRSGCCRWTESSTTRFRRCHGLRMPRRLIQSTCVTHWSSGPFSPGPCRTFLDWNGSPVSQRP